VYPYRGSSVVLTTAYWTAIYDIKGNFVINHPGVDLSNNRSDPIVAVADGKVVYAKNLPLSDQKSVAWWISGETVFLRSETTDGKALCTIYGHGVPGTMKVTLGQTIHAGDELFLAGQSGNSTGIHLHFAAKVGGTGDYCDGGQWINPMNLFASNN